jgi:hypothetical protein
MLRGHNWRRNLGSWSRRPAQGCFCRRFLGRAFGFSRGFGIRHALQVMLDLFRHIGGNRTGMRFLFGNAKTGQKVNDGFRLDLEFARELIDADLICVAHAS